VNLTTPTRYSPFNLLKVAAEKYIRSFRIVCISNVEIIMNGYVVNANCIAAPHILAGWHELVFPEKEGVIMGLLL
jgi:hypothetical protein